MKSFIYVLISAFTMNVCAFAQNPSAMTPGDGPGNNGGAIGLDATASCLDRLNDKANPGAAGVGFALGGPMMGIVFAEGSEKVGFSMAIGGVIAGTFLMIRSSNLYTIKEILTEATPDINGTAPGGINSRKAYQKLSKKLAKKNLASVSYAEFLKVVHDADVDGSACALHKIPKRKHIVDIFLDDKNEAEGRAISSDASVKSTVRSVPQAKPAQKKTGSTNLNSK